MKPWVPPLILLTLAGVGFGVAKVMSDKKKNEITIGGVDYRAELFTGDGGKMFVQMFVQDKAEGDPLGPFDTDAAAGEAMVNYIASIGRAEFYSLRNDPEFGWYFDGWSDGRRIDGEGPFATEAAAKTAGNTWLNNWLKIPKA